MAKLTPLSTYHNIIVKTGPTIITAPFVVIRIYGYGDSVFGFQNTDNGYVYPVSEVLAAGPD